MGNKPSASKTNHVNGSVNDSVHFSEIRSVKRLQTSEEGIGTDSVNIADMKGILHPDTGEILNIQEAIRLRILDVRTGKIATSTSPKSTYLSVREAMHHGLVTPELADRLLSPCGIVQNDDGKRQISLLEAIQRELVDAERGPMERLKVISSDDANEGFSIADAIEKGLIDLETGDVSDPQNSGTRMSLKEAFSAGILSCREAKPEGPRLCLFDFMLHGLIDQKTCLLFDRDTGESHNIEMAIDKNIINPSIKEVVDTSRDCKVTLKEALELGIIKNQNFHHSLSGEVLSLTEAKRRRLIIKPLSLKECVEMDILLDNGLFRSPTHRSQHTLLSSIATGVLDSDTHKTVMDKATGNLLTLSEALKRGIITLKSTYIDTSDQHEISVPQAVERGLLYSVTVIPVFEITGFKQYPTNDFVSLNSALEKGIVRKGTPITYIYNEDCMLIPSAISKGFIKNEVFEMLNKDIGVIVNGVEQTAFSAAVNGHLNPKNGLLIDPKTKTEVPFNKAVAEGIITMEGCVMLKSLLTVTLTTQTVTRTVIRYATTVQFTEQSEKFEKIPDVEGSCIITHDFQEQGLTSAEEKDLAQSDKTKKTSPIKQKLIKFLQPLKMKDTKIEDKKEKKTPLPEKLEGEEEQRVEEGESICTESREVTSVVTTKSYKKTEVKQENYTLEVPPDGWPLKTAIDNGLFDPDSGMFIIPGTDRLVSFEECVKFQIINPASASVIDPKLQTMSLEKAFHKRVLDCTGNYYLQTGEKINMREAIKRKLIVFESEQDSPSRKTPDISSSIVTSREIYLQPGTVREEHQHADLALTAQASPVTYLIDDVTTDIADAIEAGRLKPEEVKIKHPEDNSQLELTEAVKCGIVDLKTKSYKTAGGKLITLHDAAKYGFVSVCGALVASLPSTTEHTHRELTGAKPNKVDTTIVIKQIPEVKEEKNDEVRKMTLEKSDTVGKTTIVKEVRDVEEEKTETDNKATGETSALEPVLSDKIGKTKIMKEISKAEEEKTETDLTHRGETGVLEPVLSNLVKTVVEDPKYLVSVGKAKSVTVADCQGKPVVRRKVFKKKLSLEEGVKGGITDKETGHALALVPYAGNENKSLSEVLQTSGVNANECKVLDVWRGDAVPVPEAVKRRIVGIHDNRLILLIPLAKSLSFPQLAEQGLLLETHILHPFTGENLTLPEALITEILDWISHF